MSYLHSRVMLEVGLDWDKEGGCAYATGKRASYSVMRNGEFKPRAVKGKWFVEIHEGTSRQPTIIQGGFKNCGQAQAWCLLFDHDPEQREVQG